jgi:hypothetical protein
VKLPETLTANLMTTAVEADLSDLNAAEGRARARAKSHFRQQRGRRGTRSWRRNTRERARREAAKLVAAWRGYDDVLAQPALRATLERKDGVSEDDALKRAMLMDALGKSGLFGGVA